MTSSSNSEATDAIKKLSYRLEDATSAERIDAIQLLVPFAKSHPRHVGAIALGPILDLFRVYDNEDEYQESLDLIEKLIAHKDADAGSANALLIVSESKNVDLLLDLLSHRNPIIALITSQILTLLHNMHGGLLESSLQGPEGMTKLLQQLPNSSREEVRNQALVLVQLLTESNEEMKKALIFHEGFELIFNIINKEGGAKNPGVVIKDCLIIIANVLDRSKTCQQLFFGMGVNWLFELGKFVDPSMLENNNRGYSRGGDGEESASGSIAWYQDSGTPYLACAVIVMKAFANSINVPNIKHNKIIFDRCSTIVSFASHWISRSGPKELVINCVKFLSNLMFCREGLPALGKGEDGLYLNISSSFSSLVLQINHPAIPGNNIPKSVEFAPVISFGWKPMMKNDRVFVELPSLLAERYIFSMSEVWSVPEQALDKSSVALDAKGFDFSLQCLNLLDAWLCFDGKGVQCDLIMQFIVAPLPPSFEEEDDEFDDNVENAGYNSDSAAKKATVTTTHDSKRPLGFLVANSLLDFLKRVMPSNGPILNNISSASITANVDVIDRCANILALVFINGGTLTRELSTVINTSHLSSNQMGTKVLPSETHSPLLSFLMTHAGKALRLSGSYGHNIFISLLRMLSCAACGCERVVRQLLSDAANMYILDLASENSENTGTPAGVQVISAFFIGICFKSLQEAQSQNETENESLSSSSSSSSAAAESSEFSAKSFLKIIDKKIGLQRFNMLLHKPVDGFFFSASFKTFYENQVEAISKGIQAWIDSSMDNLKQIISTQMERIEELEAIVAAASNSSSPVLALDDNHHAGEGDRNILLEKISRLEGIIDSMKEEQTMQQTQLSDTVTALEVEERKVQQYHREIGDQEREIGKFESLLSTEKQNSSRLQAEIASLRKQIESNHKKPVSLLEKTSSSSSSSSSSQLSDETTALKAKILQGDEDKKELETTLHQRDKTIELLELELKRSAPVENINNERIASLESRNIELRNLIMTLESENSELKSAFEIEKRTISVGLGENSVGGGSSSVDEQFNKLLSDVLACAASQNGWPDGVNQATQEVDINNECWASTIPLDDRMRTLAGIFYSFKYELDKVINCLSDQVAQACVVDEKIFLSTPERSLPRVQECFDLLFSRIEGFATAKYILEGDKLELEKKNQMYIQLLQDLFPSVTSTEFDFTAYEYHEQMLSEYKEQFSKNVATMRKDLQNEVQDLSEAYEQLGFLLEEQKENVKEVEDKLREKQETIRDLQTILGQRDEALSEKESELLNSRKESHMLHNASIVSQERDQKYQQEIDSLRKVELSLKVQIKNNNVENAAKFEDLQKKISELESSLEVAASNAREDAMSKQETIFESLRQQIASYKEEIILSNKESQAAKQKLDEVEVDYKRTYAELLQVQAELSEFQTSEEARVKSASDKLLSEINELQAETQSLKSSIDSLRIEVRDGHVIIDTLRSEKQLLENNNATSLQDLNSEMQRMRSEISEHEKVIFEWEEHDNSQNIYIKELEVEKESICKDNIALQTQINEKDAQIRELDLDLQNSKQELTVLATIREQLDADLSAAKEICRRHDAERDKQMESERTPVKKNLMNVFGSPDLRAGTDGGENDNTANLNSNQKSGGLFSSATKKEDGKSSSWADVQRHLIGNASPAAKDVSRINSLLVKERKKYTELQEEHKDILELVAQQEVEISAFRQQFGSRLGADALRTVEEESRRLAIEKYGSYIDFRSYDATDPVNA